MKYTRVVKEDTEKIIEACNAKKLYDSFKDKTVFITGSSGMIGSYFIYTLQRLNELYNTNIKIKAFARSTNKFDDKILEDPNIEIVLGDITELEPLNIEGKIDYIIHAASPASPKIMKEHPVMTNLCNTLGTIRSLDLAKKNNSKFLFISSREIYGEPNKDQKYFTEDGLLGQVNPLVPRNGYAEGKKAAENLCISYREEFGIDAKIVRLAHTYGPGMSITDGRVQADFLNDVIHNRDIVLKSDGSSVRSYTYIADAIKGMFLVITNDTKEAVYNIADEKCETSIKELAQTMVSIDPSKGLKIVFDIKEDPNKKGTASFTGGILDTTRIRTELGWNPEYNIKDGFARTLEHLEDELNIKNEKVITK